MWGDSALPDIHEPGSFRIYQELEIVKQMYDAYKREKESGDATGETSGVREPPPLAGSTR